MSKYVLGLDVGISSVGWGIIDYQTLKIVDCGVRLFPERVADSNEKRRQMRGSRRLIRRRQHRIERIKELLLKEKIIDFNFKELENPYDIRCKGLKEKLTNDELATAILHIAKTRGISGEWAVDEEKIKENQVTKNILMNNNDSLKNKYVCELQKERLIKEGKIRGSENVFTTDQYIKEINKIFENQNISNEIKQKIIDIIKSKREYFEGPGNEKSITKYGRFFIDENGKVAQISMIDKMKGKCTIYPNEYRAAKNNYSTCLFNLLNDLNNATVNGEKIDSDTKKYIIEEYINKKGEVTVKDLSKALNIDNLDNCGFRVDEKGKILISKFDGFKKIKKLIDSNNFNKEIYENKKLLDDIIEILTSYKSSKERQEELSKIFEFSEIEKEEISKLTGFSGYHSFSRKIINELNDEMLESDMNQMQILQINGLLFADKDYNGLKNIPYNNELILSPTAKRSQKEAIKVINAVRNKYGELDSIIIEMAREKNSIDKKANINKYLKEQKVIKEKINEILNDKEVNLNTKLKVQLYLEQNCKTAYSGIDIDLNKLISDPKAYEIDHIIPLSISLNDSLNNKVLVTKKENQDKGQRTPYQYFKSHDVGRTYEEFEKSVKENNNYQGKYGFNKRKNLLFEKDINLYEVKKEFINRNLVDTRYATKGILNTIQKYYRDNDIETKVHTINGSITHMFRKKCGLDKNRNIDSSHHAVDALIISGIKKMKLFNNLLCIDENNNTYNNQTGEIITLENEEEFFDEKYLKFIGNLKDLKNVKYSYRIDSKFNKGISDQTIYGTRKINDKNYVINKYSNIYDSDGETVAKLFRENKTEKLLLSKVDVTNEHSIYNTLKKIVDDYPNEKNPFQAFYKETGEYIRKYSKNGKGPIIKTLKYIDNEMEKSVIYLDNKYDNISENKHVILKQLVPYRADIYITQNQKYKILKINQVDLSSKSNKYYISENKYKSLKEKYNIEETDKFVFSLYKETIINVDGNIVRYDGINNATYGIIHYKTIGDYKIYKKDNETVVSRPYINIKNAQVFEKYNVDVLGNMYKSNNESCKMEINMLQ